MSFDLDAVDLDAVDFDDAQTLPIGLSKGAPALTETEREHYARVKEAVANAMLTFPLLKRDVGSLVKDREISVEKSDGYARIKEAARHVIKQAKVATKHPAFETEEAKKPFARVKKEAKELLKQAEMAPSKDPALLEAEKNLSARFKEAAARIKDVAAEVLPADTLKEEISLTPPADSKAKPAWKENLGYQMIKIGLDIERAKTRQINTHLDEASKIQKKLGKLIDLNSKIATYVDTDEKKKLGEDIFKLNEELKAQGIDVLGGLKAGDSVSPERLAEIKGNVSNHTDSLKTELQTLFTTKIQVKIQEIQSILECLKTVEKYWNRLISNIIEKYKS